MDKKKNYKNIVSFEKNPAKRISSRLRDTYSLCGCGVEVGEGLGVTMRKMNSLQQGSGNVLNLSPAPSTSEVLLREVIARAA